MISTLEKPELATLQVGKQVKILQVTGEPGTEIPRHYCTGEAVLYILKGKADLSLDDRDHRLLTGQSFLIPGQMEHALKIREELKALVLMPSDAEVKYVV